jgi:hypothetical protein
MHQQLRLRLRAGGVLAITAVAGLAGCSAHVKVAREGTETFVLSTDSAASNPDYSATASGLFADRGTFPGIGDGRNASMAKLAGGTFVVTHPSADAKTTLQTVNSHSCAVVFEQRGTFTVGRGTGAYKGITGYGTDTARFTGVLPKDADGKCDTSASASPVQGSTHSVITATGSILIPPS